MLRIARVLAFGVWTGAMIGFAFIFAPTAFAHIGPTAPFAATIAASIRGITALGYGCTAVVVLACIPQIARRRSFRWLIVIALVMCALSWYEVQAIVSAMEHTALRTPAYEALHRRSSTIYSAILLLGIAGTALSVYSPVTRSKPSHAVRS